MPDTKTVIVTGSSSGIGAATARLAARNGYNVAVNYHANRAGGEAVAAECRGHGVEAIAVGADVGDDAACRALAAAALEAWGRVDALVNNAGATKFIPHGDLESLDAEEFHRLYQINTVGAFQMLRAVAPAMQASGGSIV